MKNLFKSLIVTGLVMALIAPASADAQLSTGKIGVTTNLSGISASYMLSSNMRVNGGLSLGFGEDYSQFGISGSVWMYQPTASNLSGYYGGGFNFTNTSNFGFSSSSFGLHGVYGAEYFLSSSFSANVHLVTNLGFDPFRMSFGTGLGMTWWIK